MKNDGFYKKVAKLIKRHEGLRLKPYKCSNGKLTIGWGRNLEAKGISLEEAEGLFNEDLQEVIEQIESKITFYNDIPSNYRMVLIDMCFNLGLNGLLKFKKMLKAMKDKDSEAVVNEMRNSRWYEQVGERAESLIELIELEDPLFK